MLSKPAHPCIADPQPALAGGIAVAECDLDRGLSSLGALRRLTVVRQDPEAALTLIRLHGEPVGVIGLDLRATSPEVEWTTAVVAKFGEAIRQHLGSDGLCFPSDDVLWHGLGGTGGAACQRARRATVCDGPLASVIVATRERPDSLTRCIESLLGMDYRQFEIIVVDNDPCTDGTVDLLTRRYASDPRVRYVREDRRGLATAHNRGLRAATGAIVAFTDDDVVVDRAWLSELVLPFLVHPNVVGATGLILPAELETASQIMLELHGNFSKGFEPRLYDLGRNRPDDRFFPFRAGSLGSGANMAFSTAYLREAGGFNPALGTGTKARGGDDLAGLCRLVLSGNTLAYRPGAIVWHHHHRDPQALRRQAYGYGVGFGAYLTSIGIDQPLRALTWLRLLPAATTEYVRNTMRHRQNPLAQMLNDCGALPDWPRSLAHLQIRGVLAGPAAYLRSLASISREARRSRGRPQR